jgi:hypothetical protein
VNELCSRCGKPKDHGVCCNPDCNALAEKEVESIMNLFEALKRALPNNSPNMTDETERKHKP